MSRHCTAYALGLALMLCQPAYTQELPDDFDIITIENRSDDRVNSSRIVCAAGRLHAADARAKELYDVKARDAGRFCPAIVAEAVKRGNGADLYSAMQPGKAVQELQAVLLAAAKGESHYVNAQGVRKQLTCHLAFDVGYIYGDANPDETILAEVPEAHIDGLIAGCFAPEATTRVSTAMRAGARLAQRHKKARE